MLKAIGHSRAADRRGCPRCGWTSPAGPTAGASRRWIRLLIVGLGCVLAAACTSTDSQETTGTSRPSGVPTQRDYWPTAGWRTAAPDQQGMDPAVLDDLDTMVADLYPQVRSVLVVRRGYLVYERYWQGVDVRSATKSFVSALVGIALKDGQLRGLTRPSGSSWPTSCPPPRIRGCARSPSSSC